MGANGLTASLYLAPLSFNERSETKSVCMK